MSEVNCRRYSVMMGEPQLGNVRECTKEYEYYEILEGIVEKFTEGVVETPNTTFKLDDDLYVDLGEFLDHNDIDNINRTLDEQLLDDDYGTDKHFQLLTSEVEKALDPGAEWTEEWEEYGF